MQVHYPKAGYLYLLNQLQKADENIMCLINLCVEKDQKIAELEAGFAAEKVAPSPTEKAALGTSPFAFSQNVQSIKP